MTSVSARVQNGKFRERNLAVREKEREKQEKERGTSRLARAIDPAANSRIFPFPRMCRYPRLPRDKASFFTSVALILVKYVSYGRARAVRVDDV